MKKGCWGLLLSRKFRDRFVCIEETQTEKKKKSPRLVLHLISFEKKQAKIRPVFIRIVFLFFLLILKMQKNGYK